jgi:hypothetical protein
VAAPALGWRTEAAGVVIAMGSRQKAKFARRSMFPRLIPELCSAWTIIKALSSGPAVLFALCLF